MKRTFKVTDIHWDVDYEEDLKLLPGQLVVPVEVEEEELSDEDCEYAISEYLSDKYGYCHDGFVMTEIFD